MEIDIDREFKNLNLQNEEMAGENDALRERVQRREASLGPDAAAAKTYQDMKDLVRRRELKNLQNEQRAQEATAAAFGIARNHNGVLPQEVVGYLNRQFGFDGENNGISSGGIDPKTGDFGFTFIEKDRDGNVVQREHRVPHAAQLGLMESYPDIFDKAAIAGHRKKMLESGLTEGEIDAWSRAGRAAKARLEEKLFSLDPDAYARRSDERAHADLQEQRAATRAAKDKELQIESEKVVASKREPRFPKEQMEMLREWLKSNGPKIMDADGQAIDNPDYNEKNYKAVKQAYESELLKGIVPSSLSSSPLEYGQYEETDGVERVGGLSARQLAEIQLHGFEAEQAAELMTRGYKWDGENWRKPQ